MSGKQAVIVTGASSGGFRKLLPFANSLTCGFAQKP